MASPGDEIVFSPLLGDSREDVLRVLEAEYDLGEDSMNVIARNKEAKEDMAQEIEFPLSARILENNNLVEGYRVFPGICASKRKASVSPGSSSACSSEHTGGYSPVLRHYRKPRVIPDFDSGLRKERVPPGSSDLGVTVRGVDKLDGVKETLKDSGLDTLTVSSVEGNSCCPVGDSDSRVSSVVMGTEISSYVTEEDASFTNITGPRELVDAPVSALREVAHVWIDELDALWNNSDFNGTKSGDVRSLFGKMRDVIDSLVGRVTARGDPSYQKIRTEELTQVEDLVRDNVAIKISFDESMVRIKELEKSMRKELSCAGSVVDAHCDPMQVLERMEVEPMDVSSITPCVSEAPVTCPLSQTEDFVMRPPIKGVSSIIPESFLLADCG